MAESRAASAAAFAASVGPLPRRAAATASLAPRMDWARAAASSPASRTRAASSSSVSIFSGMEVSLLMERVAAAIDDELVREVQHLYVLEVDGQPWTLDLKRPPGSLTEGGAVGAASLTPPRAPANVPAGRGHLRLGAAVPRWACDGRRGLRRAQATLRMRGPAFAALVGGVLDPFAALMLGGRGGGGGCRVTAAV